MSLATTGTHPPGGAALTYGTANSRWVLAAAVLGSGIATLDATVVGIALPAIDRSFHSDLSTLQWVVTGYAVTLAAFLLLGGALGDQFGRRRVFVIGVVWFALASALCGLAPNADTLIVARLLQGVGGALVTPASLAILQASFRPEDRARAIGAWSGLGGLATAAGPLVGGYLIAAASWRWVFFINLPISALVVAISTRHVPESRDPARSGRVDVPGAFFAVVALAALTFALIERSDAAWSRPEVWVALVVAVLAFAAFVVTEQHRARPMLPLSAFASRQFSAVNAVTFVVYGALGGALFLLPVELQLVAGYSALQSGLALLPLTAIMLAFSARSGRLASRIGPRLQMSLGPPLVGAGLVLLTRATSAGNYAVEVLPAVLVFGAGLAVTVAPLTATAMSALPPEHAGLASAVNNVVARAASLLAVAVLPLVAGLTGPDALRPHHLASGFRVAVVVAGALCAAGGLISVLTIRNPPRRRPAPACYHCALDGTPLADSADSRLASR